jgi:hypothetical protein
MSNIRELSFDEIASVSGGEGHGTEVNRERQDARNARSALTQARPYNGPNHIYSDPSTIACANSAFGAFGSLPNIGRTAAKEVGAIMQCVGGASSGNGNKAGTNHCGGGIGGTCNRN